MQLSTEFIGYTIVCSIQLQWLYNCLQNSLAIQLSEVYSGYRIVYCVHWLYNCLKYTAAIHLSTALIGYTIVYSIQCHHFRSARIRHGNLRSLHLLLLGAVATVPRQSRVQRRGRPALRLRLPQQDRDGANRHQVAQ